MTTTKRVREPGPLKIRSHIAAWISESNIAFVHPYSLTPRDLRRLAAWCERAAAYLEQQKESRP